ncbi:MAG: phosphopantothenoylcysteine decarboxylase [Candidatus Omnitrophica bacterium]|nr:phosphopantothenoylcysteine decarboxylase [Candidatus Omnitrophota bacterium]
MKVLITAGPTWVKIDDVRVITNIFTGGSGIFFGKEFKKKKCAVTLLINSPYADKLKGIKIIPFRYYDEFKEKVLSQIKNEKYDAIIHTAAVSDYKLKSIFKGKIPAAKKELILKLVPAQKVIKSMRGLAKKSVVIQFKLESKRKGLIDKAYNRLKENRSDFVVANALEDLKTKYKAFVIDKNKKVITVDSKKELFNVLYKLIKNS